MAGLEPIIIRRLIKQCLRFVGIALLSGAANDGAV